MNPEIFNNPQPSISALRNMVNNLEKANKELTNKVMGLEKQCLIKDAEIVKYKNSTSQQIESQNEYIAELEKELAISRAKQSILNLVEELSEDFSKEVQVCIAATREHYKLTEEDLSFKLTMEADFNG